MAGLNAARQPDNAPRFRPQEEPPLSTSALIPLFIAGLLVAAIVDLPSVWMQRQGLPKPAVQTSGLPLDCPMPTVDETLAVTFTRGLDNELRFQCATVTARSAARRSRSQ